VPTLHLIMCSNDLAASALNETVWLDANRFYDMERQYYEVSMAEYRQRANPGHNPSSGDAGIETNSGSLLTRMERLEKEQETMKNDLEKVTSQMKEVMFELSLVKEFMIKATFQSKDTSQISKNDTKHNIQNGSSAAPDDDLDLFGSDEENEDDVKLREERLKAYADKKSKKPALVAKSSVILDVKPWDDETDMKAMETAVKAVTTDGLVWGASKLVPLAYGIKKLQIVAIVEDEKVSIDWLQETIGDIEELVQSVDIAAFNKL